MNNMKKLILIIPIFLFSCEQPKFIEGNSNQILVSGIKYIKEKRTNLCFAESGAGNTYSFTCVPCSEEVLKQIELNK